LLGFVSVLATLGLSQARGPAPSRPLDWIFLAMIVAGVILTVASRGRVALVTTVGITGFSVALVFFSLGAADVALTQMLVEILTVVMMVMLLVRLPEGFHPSSTARRTIAAVVALAVAGVGFLLACLVTAQDHASATGGWFLGNAMDLTGGGNVVNTILVDFRALDTLGELTALGMAGICVVVSLQARGLLPMPDAPAPGATTSAAHGAKDNTLTLRAADRVLVPLLLAMALWFYLRGHQQPGGGFIAALVASAALCLVYLAAHDDSVSRLRGSGTRLIGWGIGVAVATGIANLVQTGSFLQPVKTYVLGTGLSSVLIFDLGVLLTVLGLSLVALSTLGRPTESSPLRRRGRVNVANAPTKRKEV
ncbi:MAG: hydrogen gas-evolving membrane-bound hydrogenase subunit E, partial [Luteococcus japonicus]